MIEKLVEGLTESGDKDAKSLESVGFQLSAIRSTHNALKEYVFQALLNIRNTEDHQEKLTLAVETLVEIRKYSDQEIERYASSLSLLSGKIQSVQETIALIDGIVNSEAEEKENEESEEVTTAALDNSSMLEEND
tara:strand:- start:3923 stop:4327 length:405 start_codon:yes stop_codon:yes gene_type:complete